MIGHLVRTRTYISPPFGRWVTETVFVEGDAAALVRHIIGGHVDGIQQIVEVNAPEGTARDVTEDIAIDVANAIDASQPVSRGVHAFVEDHGGMAFAREIRVVETAMSGEG